MARIHVFSWTFRPDCATFGFGNGCVSGTALDRDPVPALELEKVPRFARRRDLQTKVLDDRPDLGHLLGVGQRELTSLDETTIRLMSRLKLEVVNLGGFQDLMPAQLSGGMIKRAALARAIVMDPKLLFFDEPSAGLDPVVSAELDELILRLRDALRMTIVVVTHELESAFKIADTITVLDQGEILMTDTVDKVRHADNERIQDLLNRRPRETPVDADAYLRRLTEEHAAPV